MLLAQEGVAPHRVCQEEAAAVAVAGPACRPAALPCTASPILEGCSREGITLNDKRSTRVLACMLCVVHCNAICSTALLGSLAPCSTALQHSNSCSSKIRPIMAKTQLHCLHVEALSGRGCGSCGGQPSLLPSSIALHCIYLT